VSGKATYLITDLDMALDLQEGEVSRQSAYEGNKVVIPTHRPPLPPRRYPGTHFCQGLIRLQGFSAAGRNYSVKYFSETIGNLTRDLPACSLVPQPTAQKIVSGTSGKSVA
jgi:hypothetical protein